jgi:acyl-CoA synthetase (AMP-forming)/AMP-acid ligase II
VASRAESVSASVVRWAERVPDRVCLSFSTGGAPTEELTYADLARRAATQAGLFRTEGLRPGDAVVILGHSTPAFVTALLGAQAAGLLAVPCPPPEPLENARRVRERIREIVARCGARALVDPVAGPGDAGLEQALADVGARSIAPAGPGALADPGGAAGEDFPLAYCQFTSGSGGRAKGVLLSHDNVAANIRGMAAAYALAPDDVPVTWLPLFHDMGLVAYIFMPLVLGQTAHVMPPLAFIARPVSWLALISRVRGTMSTAPNFAYALCARKVSDAEAAALDLSSWRRACNGSEPVTRAAVEGFTRRFAAAGFRPEALLPCYGLAEDTLCATTRRPAEGPWFEDLSRAALEVEGEARPEAGGMAVASVGRAVPGQEISVIGGDGQPLVDRRIGEVAIRGDSVMSGYLSGTEGEGALSEDGLLRTGDLGYLVGGELFLVGRKKDLIIRAGRNYYPQDMEEALGPIAGLRAGRAVAFAVPGEESEQLVLAAERRPESEGDEPALRAAIRDAVRAAAGIAPDDIVIVAPQTLPLTSSGKVMRPEARRLYMAGRLKG